MRCNPWRWLWGLPLLAMWVWISGLLEQDRIQTDLQARTQQALTEAGYGWASSGYGYRDGQVSGTAPSGAAAAEALDVARKVWGTRVVEGSFDELRTVGDYVWSATRREDGSVMMSGYAPDEATRETVRAAVDDRFSGARVSDQLELARGAPANEVWLRGIGFGLDQLAQLSTGTLTLSNTGLSLVGTALTPEAYKGVKGALRSRMPNGFSLVRDGVTPPIESPYRWSAEKTNTQIVLSGFVPSAEDRKALFDGAKAEFPDLVIIDRMEIAAGQPRGFARVATMALAQLSRLRSGQAALVDTTLTLTGLAADQVVGEAIDGDFRRIVPSGYDASTALTYAQVTPPQVNPFTTGLDVTAEVIKLTGYVPSEQARSSLLSSVEQEFPGRRIVDELSLGSGQPETWRACLDAGIAGIAKLGGGLFELSDRRLDLRGKSDDETLAAGLPGDVRALANRACETNVQVLVDVPPEPDLTWRARRDDTDGLVLEGDVPDAQTRAALIDAATKLFSDVSVTDRMTVAGGYAKKWRSVSLTALSSLAKLRNGEAVITGQELLLRGEAKDTAVAAAVKDQLAHNLATGYRGRDIITVRSEAMIWAEEEARKKLAAQAEAEREAAEAQRLKDEEARRRADAEAAEAKRLADANRLRTASEIQDLKQEADKCQSLLKSANAEGAIRFRFASAALDKKSHGTLDKLVTIAETCPQFRIEIEGHTDAEGRPDRNLTLSQERAQSVVDYLVNAGVPPSRLKAVGYGETRPVAPNDTAANRARNRRIEFAVKFD